MLHTARHEQFKGAVDLLKEEVSKGALARLGLSPPIIAGILFAAALVLALAFVFIFLGISALTTGSSFGAVVNSALPVLAGGGAAAGDASEKVKEIKDKIEATVKSVIDRMTGGN